ncbi:hypothetical protein BDQ12DRAFT_685308 [Crucibulum laeve]|uniref:Uncharacterized protein n=1 Tax=Crucibulum laeve TaxID=68775 RepID=A0A5C3LX71_9AGAR|nr:hypothetical protein BDQ12DRAFT_685308 [Crucibulum laeve]
MQQIPTTSSFSLRRLEEFDSVVETMNCNTLMPPPPSNSHPQTLYMPIELPPTPAPSPGPHVHPTYATTPFQHLSLNPLGLGLASIHRRPFLSAVLASCTPPELLYTPTTIAALLKRDFIFSLPPEMPLDV